MKQKKWLIPILALVLLVQILAPVGLILYHKNLNRDISEKGEIYRVAVSIESVYDGSVRYDFVDFYNPYSVNNSTAYFVLETDDNGMTSLSESLYEKPNEDIPYIRCVNTDAFPYNRTYLIEDTNLYYAGALIDISRTDLFAPELIAKQTVALQKWYLELSVYNGNFIVRGIFDENGTPCEQALKELL
ncbi:MAG: hypothetical protein ACI4N4_00655 [Candidatus Fimenecus sp.]